MNIHELISDRGDKEAVNVEGALVPVSALKRLRDEGYENLIVYTGSKVFSVWGKNRAASFNEEELRERFS